MLNYEVDREFDEKLNSIKLLYADLSSKLESAYSQNWFIKPEMLTS